MARPHPRIPELLADGSATSRADLARLLNVAPSTASTWVGQLIEEGVIIEDGMVSSGGGRPRRRLRLNRPLGHLLVADLGGHHARLGVADQAGGLLHSATAPVAVADGPEKVMESLAGSCASRTPRGHCWEWAWRCRDQCSQTRGR